MFGVLNTICCMPAWSSSKALYDPLDMALSGAGLGLLGSGLPVMSHRALLYRRPSEPHAIEIIFDRSIYLVRMRRHRQARRYTLRIAAATREVILTIPPRGTVKEARAFAQKHGGWIAARLGRLPEAVSFAHGVTVPLRGVPHRITHRRSARGTVWTETDAEGRRLLCVAGEAPHVDRRIADFLRREAKRELETASLRYAAELGVSIRRVSVRDQASRWGSCSTDRRAVILVAAHSRTELRAELSRGARSRPSGRDESFQQVLAPGSAAVPRPRTGQDMARRSRQRFASLRSAAAQQCWPTGMTGKSTS